MLVIQLLSSSCCHPVVVVIVIVIVSIGGICVPAFFFSQRRSMQRASHLQEVLEEVDQRVGREALRHRQRAFSGRWAAAAVAVVI